MAAAYAAVVSLMQTMEHVRNHPDPPISVDDEQLQSLTETVAFFQDFLEAYSQEADGWESGIADAAYAAEDVIESHIVDRIFAGCNSALVSLMHTAEQIQCHPNTHDKEKIECLTANISFLQDFLQIDAHVGSSNEAGASDSHIADASENVIRSQDQGLTEDREIEEIYSEEEISSIEFYQCLQKVMEVMELIKEDLMEIKAKFGVRSHLRRSSSASSRPPSSLQSKSMVGFDDVLVEMMDKLTGGQAARQIIPISGMAGIGKTTLARNIYANPLIQQHFDVCAWATISQEYSTFEILRGILCEHREYLSDESDYELGEMLYKKLSGRRYLIVMDDMWSTEAWDAMKFFFPDYNNGSRIVITTRLSSLALQLSDSYGVEMKLLDEDQSWKLFKSVLADGGCPLAFEEIGRKIAKGCKGLPLSIIVIGGLLAESRDVQEYWEYIAENLNSVVNLEDNECCLKILHMSYNQLPVYLKPCFLYMGVFPEDDEIRASELIKMWVAEGLLKPIDGKSLEKVAEEYLMDLIGRNLVLVHKLGSNGKTKLCKIHDLLRDLCLREAQKEKFLSAAKIAVAGRRICIHQSDDIPQAIRAMDTATVARSFISNGFRGFSSFGSRLLRVCSVIDDSLPIMDKSFSAEDISQQVNLRFFAVDIHSYDPLFRFPSSTYLFWNLQTFIVKKFSLTHKIIQFEIWRMPLLRHIKFDAFEIPDPPRDEPGAVVLENLQTLSCVHNFFISDEAVRRIPSIKKLEISYYQFKKEYHLNNLDRLHKLESLNLYFQPDPAASISKVHLKQNITFPESLKKLTLQGTSFRWEDMATAIGSLPFLEVLKLNCLAFVGAEWETVEGQFCRLKYLLVSEACSLKRWTTESAHFPRLERLLLVDLHLLEEIPLSVGDIGTLELIYLEGCGSSVVASATRILEEQEELGNFDLKVVICSDRD